jgi:hypothetical protein
MKTDESINVLSNDGPPRQRLWSGLVVSAATGTVVAAALFFGEIGFRPDIAEAVHSIQFSFKSVVTIFVSRYGRRCLVEAFTPNEDFRSSSPLLVTPILLACDVHWQKSMFRKSRHQSGFSRVPRSAMRMVPQSITY